MKLLIFFSLVLCILQCKPRSQQAARVKDINAVAKSQNQRQDIAPLPSQYGFLDDYMSRKGDQPRFDRKDPVKGQLIVNPAAVLQEKLNSVSAAHAEQDYMNQLRDFLSSRGQVVPGGVAAAEARTGDFYQQAVSIINDAEKVITVRFHTIYSAEYTEIDDQGNDVWKFAGDFSTDRIENQINLLNEVFSEKNYRFEFRRGDFFSRHRIGGTMNRTGECYSEQWDIRPGITCFPQIAQDFPECSISRCTYIHDFEPLDPARHELNVVGYSKSPSNVFQFGGIWPQIITTEDSLNHALYKDFATAMRADNNYLWPGAGNPVDLNVLTRAPGGDGELGRAIIFPWDISYPFQYPPVAPGDDAGELPDNAVRDENGNFFVPDGITLNYMTLPGVNDELNDPFYDNADKGATMVHEVGHWLGLLHIFQDMVAYPVNVVENGTTVGKDFCSTGCGVDGGFLFLDGDEIDDTPPMARLRRDENDNTGPNPNFENNVGNCNDDPNNRVDTCQDDNEIDAQKNMMSYSDDSCTIEKRGERVGFTPGQWERMALYWAHRVQKAWEINQQMAASVAAAGVTPEGRPAVLSLDPLVRAYDRMVAQPPQEGELAASYLKRMGLPQQPEPLVNAASMQAVDLMATIHQRRSEAEIVAAQRMYSQLDMLRNLKVAAAQAAPPTVQGAGAESNNNGSYQIFLPAIRNDLEGSSGSGNCNFTPVGQ